MDLYIGSNNVLYAKWHGYSTVQSVKDGSLAILRLMEEHECYRLISDDRGSLGTWTPAIEWLEREFMPEFIRRGMKKIAHIYSEDDEAIHSMNRFLEIDLDYETQVFHDFRTASLWLTGEITNPPKINSICEFKTNKGVKVIDCKDVYFFSKFDSHTILQLKEDDIEINYSLKEIESKVPSEQFMRVHRSYIVNLSKIKELRYHAGGYYHAYFKDLGNRYLTISRNKVNDLKEALNIL